MAERRAPKRLQRKGDYEQALDYYISRYSESLKTGDRFLSALYLDEVAGTLTMIGKKTELKTLDKKVRESIVENLGTKQEEDFEEDLEIVLRKRFPERYKERISSQVELSGDDKS